MLKEVINLIKIVTWLKQFYGVTLECLEFIFIMSRKIQSLVQYLQNWIIPLKKLNDELLKVNNLKHKTG